MAFVHPPGKGNAAMITIELPWPSPLLSSNARVHYMARATATKDAKHVAWWRTRAVTGTLPAQTLPVTITFHPPNNRRRDRHNCQDMVKAAIDGVAQAIGIDDFHWRIDWAWDDTPPDGKGKVVFTLRPLVVNVPLIGRIG
jgi:crossover junction endodeoxyribonuclease RusA